MGLKLGKIFSTPQKNFFSYFALLFKKRCYVGKIKSKYPPLTVFSTPKFFFIFIMLNTLRAINAIVDFIGKI